MTTARGQSTPVTVSPKLRAYLADLIKEEGYGGTPAEVMQHLIWRGIETLIGAGVLDRRAGTFKGKDSKPPLFVTFECNPTLMLYLKELVRSGLWGNSVDECAMWLVSKAMEDIVDKELMRKLRESRQAMGIE